MDIMEARKWAFERMDTDRFETIGKMLAEAEAIAIWVVSGDYEPPPELPIGDKGLS